MGDMGEYWNDIKEYKKAIRNKYGIECQECKIRRPKTNASILLPQQKCKVDHYLDPRPRLTEEQEINIFKEA